MDLLEILESIKNAKRSYRDSAASYILRNPELISGLVDKVFDTADQLHIRAAWVLELICLEDVTLLDPFIHVFINGMSKLTNESALRPVSKVCSLWCTHYFVRNEPDILLRPYEIEQLISTNFDWLIEDHKVATQVFAMDTLQILGNEVEWIHNELRSVLQKNAESGTSGYRAHARKILKNLHHNGE